MWNPALLRPLILGGAVTLLFFACGKDTEDFNTGGDPTDQPPPDTGPFATGDTGDTATSGGGGDSADTGPSVTDDSAHDSAHDSEGDTGVGVVGTGYGEGDVAFNLTANDQTNSEWRLYQQHGAIVVLVLGDSYEGNFQYIAEYLPSLQSRFDGDGVRIVTGLINGADTTAADVKDAQQIAADYGLNPVLYIDDVTDAGLWASTRPVVYVIDRDLTISQIGNNIVYEDEVETWVEALL
jgi:hypothetical protein